MPSSSARAPRDRTTPRSSREAPVWIRWAFLACAGLTAVGAPWMIGGEPLPTQWLLLGAAAATLITGLLTRWLDSPTPGARAAWHVQRWVILLGAALLVLQLWQALNPSHLVVITGNSWRLTPLPDVSAWTPKSLQAPIDDLPGDALPYRNAWRYLLIFSLGWAYVSGLALGLTRREDAVRWTKWVALNGVLLAVVCLVHRISGEDRTLWRFVGTFDFSHSPVFFYKNHNGAYLAASLAVLLSLAAKEERSSQRLAWSLGALVVWAATVIVNSRVATVCATLWLIGYAVQCLRQPRRESMFSRRWHLVVVAATAAALCLGLLAAPGARRALGRFQQAVADPGDFMQGGKFRSLIREVGLAMWLDRPAFGWGGGSYLYLYNSYHRQVPEVARYVYQEQPRLNRFYWPTANCDWIEFLVEYGAVGTALFTGMVLVTLVAWFRWRKTSPPGTAWLVVAVAGLCAHAWFDYILRNPALLILFLGLLVVLLRISVPGQAKRRPAAVPPRKTAAGSA